MSKFIIIEGTDNTGKDTQQNLIIEKVNNLVFHKVHYSALPFKDDKAKHKSYSTKMYTDIFKMIMKIYIKFLILLNSRFSKPIINLFSLNKFVFILLYRTSP